MRPLHRDINILTQSLDIEEFKSTTVRKVLKETDKNFSYEKTNPNPIEAFPGIDGKWYIIDFPSKRFNCYLFSLGWTIDIGPKIGYGYPGIMIGKLPKSKMESVNFIMHDLNAVGREVHELYMGDIPKKLPKAEEGTYWIKVFFVKGTDEKEWETFHTARKDEASGRWLHKLGWYAPAKVMLNNLEFSTFHDYLMQNNQSFRKLSGVLPREKLKEVFGILGYDIDEKFVTRSKLETKDNAPYKAYNPEENPNEFIIYEPYAVLRIDE